MSTQTRSAPSLDPAMNSRAKLGLFLAFCTSVGLHGVAYAALSVERRTKAPASRISELNFELAAPPTAEPEPPSKELTPTAHARPAPARPPPANHAVGSNTTPA